MASVCVTPMAAGGKGTRQDARYRRLQSRVYNFLERPKSWQSITYHVVVFASVFVCLLFSVLSTIPEYKDVAGELLFYLELGMLFWFFTEYCMRMWSAGCRSRYQSCGGRLQFARRPFCVVDVIVIVASIAVLALGSDRQMFAASALRGLRFFQILRMIRMDRRGGSWKLLASVVWAHRQELFTTVYIGFLLLIFTSFLIYLVEKDVNPKINTFASALWWGVITLCTVGYGDTVPKTWMGKIIAGFCAVAGISFFALPAGILGSGFALKVQQHQRQKHLIRRRVPAATLIQCLWRCYAADPHSNMDATWKIYVRPAKSSPRFGRFSTLRRSRSDKSQMSSGNYANFRRNAVADVDDANAHPPVCISKSLTVADHTSMPKQPSVQCLVNKDEPDDEIYATDVAQLTCVHRTAIRSIRMMTYLVARRKFREALRPYDVKDVIEQYSAGHLDMLSRIKVLQGRLDQILGRQGAKDKDIYESKYSLASKVVNIERQIGDIECKVDCLLTFLNSESAEASESSATSVTSSPPIDTPATVDNSMLAPPSMPSSTIMACDTTRRHNDDSTNPSSVSPKHKNTIANKLSCPDNPYPCNQIISKSAERPILRIASDLGPRSKKRVTYRFHFNSVQPDTSYPEQLSLRILDTHRESIAVTPEQTKSPAVSTAPMSPHTNSTSYDNPAMSGSENDDAAEINNHSFIDFTASSQESLALITASADDTSRDACVPRCASKEDLSITDDDNVAAPCNPIDQNRNCSLVNSVCLNPIPSPSLPNIDGGGVTDQSRFRLKPESQPLLMRPDVKKLKKTVC